MFILLLVVEERATCPLLPVGDYCAKFTTVNRPTRRASPDSM
jgi:hypothetical protein